MTAAADTLQTITLGALGVAGTKGLGGDAAQSNSRAGANGNDGVPGQSRAVLVAP